MEDSRYIIGLNDPGIPGDAEAWIVSSPMLARVRVVGLIVSPTCAPFFEVLAGAVGDLKTSAIGVTPFVTRDPVTALVFLPCEGGRFDLPAAAVGQVVGLRVRNTDISYRHEFRGAFLAVAKDLPS
jgi:hypothetical protein